MKGLKAFGSFVGICFGHNGDSLGAYSLPLNLAYRLQKKLTFKYLFVFQLNYPISYLWTRMLL